MVSVTVLVGAMFASAATVAAMAYVFVARGLKTPRPFGFMTVAYGVLALAAFMLGAIR